LTKTNFSESGAQQEDEADSIFPNDHHQDDTAISRVEDSTWEESNRQQQLNVDEPRAVSKDVPRGGPDTELQQTNAESSTAGSYLEIFDEGFLDDYADHFEQSAEEKGKSSMNTNNETRPGGEVESSGGDEEALDFSDIINALSEDTYDDDILEDNCLVSSPLKLWPGTETFESLTDEDVRRVIEDAYYKRSANWVSPIPTDLLDASCQLTDV
jgi:hypothetical protein